MNEAQVTTYSRLVIEHNHGHCTLENVTVDEHGEAQGTVVDGGVTNRLFHVTSYHPFEKGTLKSWPLYGRKPYPTGKPGEFRVNCCFC